MKSSIFHFGAVIAKIQVGIKKSVLKSYVVHVIQSFSWGKNLKKKTLTTKS